MHTVIIIIKWRDNTMDKYYRARVRARWGIDEVMLCGYTFQEAIKRFLKTVLNRMIQGTF